MECQDRAEDSDRDGGNDDRADVASKPDDENRDAEYHLRPHAGGHRCGRLGRWPDRRRDWAEGFEKALYQSRTRFSQITRHSPSAVNQTNAGKRAA